MATCTVVVGAQGERCGLPAVHSFESAWVEGEMLHECAKHSTKVGPAKSPRRDSFRVEVRGQVVTGRTPRRYLVVAVRPAPVRRDAGVYVAFARVEKRTDNLETARKAQRSYYAGPGSFAVVVDLETKKEI